MLVDLTMPFGPETTPVPGHPRPTLEPLHRIDRDGVRNTIACFSIHTGTHVDAPSHFVPDGRTIDEIDVDRFVRPGIRLDLSAARPGEPITLEMLERAGFDGGGAGKIVVLATGWADSSYRNDQLYAENPYLDETAAAALAEAAPSALALDFPVDCESPWPNHKILLGAEVLLIENLLKLLELPPSGFEISALPLRLVGENGGPARVVARLPAGS